MHHKDVKLSELLDVVHSKLDASLDFNATKVCRVDAADAAADLLIHNTTEERKHHLSGLNSLFMQSENDYMEQKQNP